MADRVRFVLDRLASFFNQVVALSLLSDNEMKAVIKRVTDYEYLMMRREMHESDVTPYVEYAINFDKLLTSRIEAHKSKSSNYKEKDSVQGKDWINGSRQVASILTSHISYIFERIIRRFPNSIQLWDYYLSFLKAKDSRVQLNAAFGRALSLHPEVERLWIQAAAHELSKNQNVHSARVLLQRGLRANKASQVLWLKYFDIEVYNASKVTTRKRSLSISTDNTALLGVPLVVLRHALISVPGNISFAFEFVRRASAVSPLLAEKVIEYLDSHFAGSLEFWKNRIASFLQFSSQKSENGGENDEGEVGSFDFDKSSMSHISLCSNQFTLVARDSPFAYTSEFDIVEDSLATSNEALDLIESMKTRISSSFSSIQSSSSSASGGAVAPKKIINLNRDSTNLIEMDSLEMIVARLMSKINLISDFTQNVPSKRTKRGLGLSSASSDKVIDQGKDIENFQRVVKDNCSKLSVATSSAKLDGSSALEMFKIQITSLTVHLRLDILSRACNLKSSNSKQSSSKTDVQSELYRLGLLKDLVSKVNSFIREYSAKSLFTEGLAQDIFDRVCHYLILVVEYYQRLYILSLASSTQEIDLTELMDSILKVVSVSHQISQSKYIAQLYVQLVSFQSYLTSHSSTTSSSSSTSATLIDSIVTGALTCAKTDPKHKSALLVAFMRHAGLRPFNQFLCSFRQIEAVLNLNPHVLPSLSLGPYYYCALDIAEAFLISKDNKSSNNSSSSNNNSNSSSGGGNDSKIGVSSSKDDAVREIVETALKRCSGLNSAVTNRFASALEGIMRLGGHAKEANLLKWSTGAKKA